MILIRCDNWKTSLFIKVYPCPEVVTSSQALAFFETSDLKEVHFFYLHNTINKVKVQCKH